ncbi:MAG: biosynthetic-type acetolactate synthase large subunit [Gemmatimonadales bacterium]|nr:biosynthetic-type acetolactate synthase large subunit [Gemmatimonadales bacterium]MYG49037.1 biosynthetic-type acetolactate synthase large subunit [Gemmatimonadales bacterium]MYK00888.1 biosynthetic-type acetolactate synthase large subunit [Candidatus Palauibacter ramosifaciens]
MELERAAVPAAGQTRLPGLERDLARPSNTISGAEAVVRSLAEGGVRTVFGYPGGAIMPVYDALFDHGHEIRHVLVRHEQGSIHAAEGYARACGRTGVCIATSGPGATNLITGIADAKMDSTPVVCITGQVPSSALGSDAFQETDVISVSAPLTKWNHQITDPAEIPAMISKALYLARSGRPGPVLVDITKDAQIGTLAYRPHEEEHEIRGYEPFPTLDEERVEAACRLIDRAKRPLVLVGQGVLLSGAQKELGEFVEKAGLPFACTLLGLGAITSEHPLYVGLLGMHGNYGPNIKTNECDLLVAVGMRFDDRVTGDLAKYARQAKVVHLDIDASEIGKNVPAEVEILADAREALGAMTTRVRSRVRTAWLAEFAACDAVERARVIENDLNPASPELRMSEVMDRLAARTGGRALVIADVGQHQMAAARYYGCREGGAFITSGGLGTMGFALPAAMGVGLARRDRPVVAVIGDGGFQMTSQELATIVEERIPVKVMILNNGYLGMVRQWQELFFRRRYSQTELTNPDFVAIAEAYGMEGRRVSERTELDASIDEMLSSEAPYLLEVVVEREENVFPMVPAGAGCAEIRLE